MSSIHICSRRQAMAFTPEVRRGSLCISIGSRGQADGRLVDTLFSRFEEILRLSFDDTEGAMTVGCVFSTKNAHEILAAARRISPGSCLMVHCEGGVSRSVAVGFFLGKLLDREIVLHAATNLTMGNRLVLAKLKRAYLIDCATILKMPSLKLLRLNLPTA